MKTDYKIIRCLLQIKTVQLKKKKDCSYIINTIANMVP